MSRPITYSPLSDPGGLTPKEWAREIRLFKSRGWLQDPENLGWPDDPDDPKNIGRRRSEAACLRCCWRGKCKKARRCLHIIPLGIREHRHKIWPDTWKARSEMDRDDAAFVRPERLTRLRFLG
jgi:hypothetical protein